MKNELSAQGAHNAFVDRRIRAVPVPVVVWRAAFLLVDALLRWRTGRNPYFSYRFNSNARTLVFSNERLRRTGALDKKVGFADALRESTAR